MSVCLSLYQCTYIGLYHKFKAFKVFVTCKRKKQELSCHITSVTVCTEQQAAVPVRSDFICKMTDIFVITMKPMKPRFEKPEW